MSGSQDGQGTGEHRSAGPVAGEGGPAGDPRSSSTPPSPTPPAEDASQVQTDLDALIADTQRERDEYLDLAKRTKADFENYRKRMAADVQTAAVKGKATLVGELVHVIDNLERALEAAGIDPAEDGSESENQLAQGILLTYRDLCIALKGNGVEAFDPTGERFDPTWHEALTTKPSDSDAGTVVETMQKGYRLGEQLIRPARVVVSE